MWTDASWIMVVGLLWPVVAGDLLFASLRDPQNLATRISCQMEEEQHFQYSSETSLWGSMGGKILIEADLLLQCLGADLDGKYGSEALKYNVEISRMKMSEETQRIVRREKRGATRDFFSNSWKKVKNFFNRMIGRRCPPPQDETRASAGEDAVTDSTDDDDEPDEVSADLYTVPFQLVQWANGSIPEIRFSEMEVEDGRVKNFKRHLADAFATQLHSLPQREVVERSVMGEHTSTYNISIAGEKSNYNAAGLVSTSQPPKSGGPVIVVNKVVTTGDIVRFAPSDALNDKERMDIRSHQMQMFHDGRMTRSRGVSSLSLVTSSHDGVKRRRKRSAEEDVTSYIRTETTFDLQLRRRSRRSVEDRHQHQKHIFRAASRIAEVEDVRRRHQLSDFQKSVDLNLILDDLREGMAEDKFQSVSEVIKQEISLKLDEEDNSLCHAIRRTFTLGMMEDVCARNASVCKDYLQLVALAGGDTAERIFLHFLGNTSRCPPETTHIIADILSDIARPSPHLLMELSQILEDEGATAGALSISLGHLASSAGPDVKGRVSDLLSKMLEDRECEGDPLMIDLLEAVGNLKCDRITERILEVCRRCRKSSGVQIASIHSLRHSSSVQRLEEWMVSLLEEGDCDVVKEVIASLIDKIQDQEMTPGVFLWPRFHFNRVDEILKRFVEERGDCCSKDVLLYFSRKKNVEANDISLKYFDPEVEPLEPSINSSSSRYRRRALWDDLNCQEWSEDRDNPIHGEEEDFVSDRTTYNRRKSCLAFRKLGVKGANAEIYAGMFAGVKEPISDPPKYKLFTKFVSGFNFLGQQTELGSFYFYLYSGKTKAYVRIMGRTRQEFTNDGCTPTELRYRPLKHIPLYMVSIANVQLSLGIHLSSRLSVDTLCPESDVYQLQPLTDVRIGGEALGTVGFIRGAANLGANFNYKLLFTFTPTPNMCLKGSHGFDPMSINFESYFQQLWNSVKQDWGKSRVWKPSFMSWELKRGDLKQWFDDTCIALEDVSPSGRALERELE